MACIPKGFNAMISPILILTLAVSLKATITSLGASIYDPLTSWKAPPLRCTLCSLP